MSVRFAVPREVTPLERRVALVPEVVQRLTKAGHALAVEAGAGLSAGYPDAAYSAAGARLETDRKALFSSAEILLKVQPPTGEETGWLSPGSVLVCQLNASRNLPIVSRLRDGKVTSFALELLPRITRAQGMDVLSSQATVAGYRAGLTAAEHLAKFFPMFMTSAGTVPPARVLVMGAGVAGLQAIATARRLGAVVRAYDVRAAAKEEVQSLGAKFVELELEAQDGAGGYAREQSAEYLAKQRELLANEVASADVVITTAQIPGRKAPVLVTADMVERMAEGAVVVDMAADSGGNCELSVAGQDIVAGGVTIVGMSNPPASMPTHASFLYARNIANVLGLLVHDGVLSPDFDDEIVAGTCVVRDGVVVHAPTAEALGLAAPPGGSAAPPGEDAAPPGDADQPTTEEAGS